MKALLISILLINFNLFANTNPDTVYDNSCQVLIKSTGYFSIDEFIRPLNSKGYTVVQSYQKTNANFLILEHSYEKYNANRVDVSITNFTGMTDTYHGSAFEDISEAIKQLPNCEVESN